MPTTITANTLFTTAQLTTMLHTSSKALCNYIEHHPELRPKLCHIPVKGMHGRHNFYTMAEADSVASCRNQTLDFSALPDDETFYTTADFADIIPETAIRTNPVTETANPITAAEPVTTLAGCIKAIHEDENVRRYCEFKMRFESLTTAQLVFMFKPMCERFKYSFIIANTKGLQSQTLTYVAKGHLKGLKEYALTFEGFLELLDFCERFHCDLNEVQ